jgi:iron-sulfur cluster repair protein YtfE (RIC family)
MSGIGPYLQADHRYCESLFALIEPLAADGQWSRAEQARCAFASSLEHHLQREERVLFPAIEEAQGGPVGLIAEAHEEHARMRDRLRQLAAAISVRDLNKLSTAARALQAALDQHNVHEESVLYPLAEQMLDDRAGDLVQAMEGQRALAGGR